MPSDQILGDSVEPSFAGGVIVRHPSMTRCLVTSLLHQIVGGISVTADTNQDEPVQAVSTLTKNSPQPILSIAGTLR
jgi:hypothetical protein